MILAMLSRFSKCLIASIVCSLPIHLGYVAEVTSKDVFFLAFVPFLIAVSIDTYQFSLDFWEKNHYFVGLLFPLLIYTVMAFLSCLIFPPVVFNRIFLPLRFAGCFGLHTIKSIPIVSGGIIAIVTVIRFFAARAGRLLDE